MQTALRMGLPGVSATDGSASLRGRGRGRPAGALFAAALTGWKWENKSGERLEE